MKPDNILQCLQQKQKTWLYQHNHRIVVNADKTDWAYNLILKNKQPIHQIRHN
jgi:hypothetical protein